MYLGLAWGLPKVCNGPYGALAASVVSGLLAVQGVRYFYRAPWSAPAQVLRACLSWLLGEITKGLLGSCLGLLGEITKGPLGCCLGESLGGYLGSCSGFAFGACLGNH